MALHSPSRAGRVHPPPRSPGACVSVTLSALVSYFSFRSTRMDPPLKVTCREARPTRLFVAVNLNFPFGTFVKV